MKDLKDDTGSPTIPYFLATKLKPHVCHFQVFGCPAVFKKYDFTTNGKRSADKYSQQGICDIFVDFPTDPAGWLFYVPDENCTYIPMVVIFYEDFTSPLHLPTLPYQGVVRLRSLKIQPTNTDTITEFTGSPSGNKESFPNDLYLQPPSKQQNDVSHLHRREPPKTRSQTHYRPNLRH